MGVAEDHFQILHPVLRYAMTSGIGLGNGQVISNLNVLCLPTSPRVSMPNSREMPVSIFWQYREDNMVIGEEGVFLGC